MPVAPSLPICHFPSKEKELQGEMADSSLVQKMCKIS